VGVGLLEIHRINGDYQRLRSFLRHLVLGQRIQPLQQRAMREPLIAKPAIEAFAYRPDPLLRPFQAARHVRHDWRLGSTDAPDG
jgi:hypothetical protein